MNKYIKYIPLLLSVFTTNAFSADKSPGTYTIESIRVSDSTGFTYINPAENITVKNSDCSSSDMFAIDKNADSYQQIYSALLTAATSSKSVTLWVSTDSSDCLNNRQRITVAQINF